MRCAVIGAGAVGTLLAVTLARTGNDVLLIVRPAAGKQPERRRVHIEKTTGGRTVRVDLRHDHDPEPVQAELVVLCVQAHALAEAVTQHAELIVRSPVVIGVQAGIPWWYFIGTRGRYAGKPLTTLDPHGKIAAVIQPDRIIGGVLEGSVAQRAGGNGLGSSPATSKPSSRRTFARRSGGRCSPTWRSSR